ncbi:MAG: hypothetical protein AB8G99_21435 [Planctomycetaceae bacterium]
MDTLTQPVRLWWNSFKGLIGTFFVEMGPSEYGYILAITFVAGYIWLRSGTRK